MATAVRIELMVDEKGAVQGVRSFDNAIKGSAATTSQLDGNLKQLNVTMNKVATSGAAAGRAGNRAMHEVKEGGMSAREGLHLVQEELELHIPRGFRNLIAESKLAQSAVSALSGVIAGVGMAQVGFLVFEQLTEEAHKLWEEHISLTKAAEDYEEELKKIKEQDFGNTSSIETTISRLHEAKEAAHSYQEAALKMRSGLWSDVAAGLSTGGVGGGASALIQDLVVPRKMVDEGFKKQRQADTLSDRQLEQEHEMTRLRIEYNHSLDDTLSKDEKRAAGLRKASQLATEDREFANRKQGARGNPVDPHSGEQEQQFKINIAKNEAFAEAFQEQKEMNREIRKLEDEARQAELGGIALLEDQRIAADREWRAEHGNNIKAIRAIDEKYYADERKLIDEQRKETEKFVGRAALNQFTGVSKLQQQSVLDIADIRGDKNLTDATKDERVAAVKMKLATDVAEQQRQYIQQTDELEQEAEARSLTGLARIRAEAERTIAAKELAFKTQYGQLSPDSAEYQQAHQQLNRQKTIINGSADQQAREYLRNSLQETEQMEAEAHIKMLSAEKQQTAAIGLEYQERTRKFREELDQQIASGKLSLDDMKSLQEDYNRKVAAAAEQRDAELVEAARQAREKMAGEFTRFFRDPMGAMKEMGEKAAGEMAARMFQQVQNRHSGTHIQEQGFSDQWSLGKIFDRIPGIKSKSAPQSEQHRAETIASSAFTLAHAEIRVAMANISMPAFAGAAAAPGGTASGAALSSGSTSLLGMPGTFGQGDSTTDLARITGPIGMGGSHGFESSGRTNPVGGAISDVNQGIGLFKQAKGIFGSSKSTSEAGGSLISSSGTNEISEEPMQLLKLPGKNLSSNGGMMANLGGAAGGAMGLFSAYQGNGGAGGALGGALSGMELGMAVGGPIGAAVGLVGGAVLGAIGFGGREKARVYDLKTVRPRLGDDFQAFQTGGMDYTSAYSDMQALDMEARKTLGKMGGSAKAYYWDTVNKEIRQAEGKLTAEEKAGRSGQTVSAAQFDVGADFVPRDGFAFIHHRERIMPSDKNERITRALEAGADDTILQGMQASRNYGFDSSEQGYRTAMRSSGSGSSRTLNISMPIHAIDTKDFAQRIHDVKHQVRSALNSSFEENSGGADASY